jgi:hypothetical protein
MNHQQVISRGVDCLVAGNNPIGPLKFRLPSDFRHLAGQVWLVKLLASACRGPVEVAAPFAAAKRRAAPPTPGPEPEDQASSLSPNRPRPLGSRQIRTPLAWAPPERIEHACPQTELISYRSYRFEIPKLVKMG